MSAGAMLAGGAAADHDADIRRVGIVGCGVMGSGIAQICATSGLDVRVVVSSDTSAAAGRKRVADGLDRGVRKATLTPAERDAALERISFTTDLGELGDRQFVVEAIREHEPDKVALFATLDKIVEDPTALLASNTSSVPIVRLARATGRASHVLGVHFFNPVPVLPLVELVGSVLTNAQTRARAESFVTGVLGKQVIHSPDRAGFVVNALLFPYLLSAIRMVESGLAPAEVIDRGMVLACAHPMGPLRLVDLVGLDTTASIAAVLYEEFKEPLYSPPPLLLRMVEGGLLGRKAGRGFYTYP
jgi:3-hydroxybutyryl-CoA dehydrogenase